MPRPVQPLALFGIDEEQLGRTAFGAALYPSDSPMTVAALAAAVHPVTPVPEPVPEPVPAPPVQPEPSAPPQRVDDSLTAAPPQRVDVSLTAARQRNDTPLVAVVPGVLHPRRLLLPAAAVVALVSVLLGAVALGVTTRSEAAAPVAMQEARPIAAEPPAETAARIRAGEQLERNPALILGPTAAELVAAGRVDARLLLILGTSLAVAPSRVADFPGDDPIRHRMLLSSYEGLSLTRNESSAPTPEAVAAATAWLARLSGEFTPTSIDLTDAGLLVTLDQHEPTGLLPSDTP